MMEEEALLQAHGIKPTAIRLLIIRNIRQLSDAFSFEDLYQYLETVDRSTVFRTVTLFEKQKLLHGFEDGMGKRKYCLCMDQHDGHACHNHEACHHVHLTCRVCGRTYCLPSAHTPDIHLPMDFEVENVNYVITGVCAHCQPKNKSRKV